MVVGFPVRVGRCHAGSTYCSLNGGLAQLGEHLPYKQRVSGSIPLTSTYFFESLAQSVEHLTFNQRVRGSNPLWLIYIAGVAELADAPDLGSGAARRGGSSPFTRTLILI